MTTNQGPLTEDGVGNKYGYVDEIAKCEHIPIVKHIIPDDVIPELRSKQLRPIDLELVVKLFSDPHTVDLHDRHNIALLKLCKRYHQGFLMKDLLNICHLLNMCADRVEEHSIYMESFLAAIQILGLPFIKEKTSDALLYQQIATETISQIGYLFRVNNAEIRLKVCHSLSDLYCNKALPVDYKDLQPCDLKYMQQLFEQSDLPDTLVAALAMSRENIQVLLAVVDLIQKLTRKSALCCEKILTAKGASAICQQMNISDPSGELLFRSVEVLWNLMEHSSNAELAEQLSQLDCVEQIRMAFLHQLSRGFSHYDRQLRNDLLVLATLVASINHTAPFLETGFVKQLVLLATFQEVKSHNPLVRSLKLMRNHEDFEFKKLIINILVILSQDPAVLPMFTEGHLILALFHYVRPNEEEEQLNPSQWSPAYFEEIQLHAMAALATLCPRMMPDYMTCNGSTIILLLLEWVIGPTDFGGHGNSFHGAGGRGNKRAQMRHCVRLMAAMINTREEALIAEFVDQGALHMLTGILSRATASSIADDAIDIEIQCDILIVLATLCETDQHRKELFGAEGIDTLTAYLKLDRSKLTSGLGHHRLLICAIECVWCTVIGCYTSEDYFLEKDGAFLLLDILEDAPWSMQNQVLGCLLDLSENVKAYAHISQWRGHKVLGQTVAHLLCGMWRQEEQRMGVLRTANNTIEEGQHPLMSQSQRQSGNPILSAEEPTYAIVDVSENMRSKIYSLFRRIGYLDLEGITAEDNVTLTIIERYLDFKMGEVWHEVEKELEEEGIRPISPDVEAMQWIERCRVDNAQQVASTQQELLKAQMQQDEISEQRYYKEIRENHRQKEKTLRDFADYVARTSNYENLKSVKEQQIQAIEASRLHKKYQESKQFHTANINNLQTTVFCGELVNIESTPCEIFGGHMEARSQYRDSKNSQQKRHKASRMSHRSVELVG